MLWGLALARRWLTDWQQAVGLLSSLCGAIEAGLLQAWRLLEQSGTFSVCFFRELRPLSVTTTEVRVYGHTYYIILCECYPSLLHGVIQTAWSSVNCRVQIWCFLGILELTDCKQLLRSEEGGGDVGKHALWPPLTHSIFKIAASTLSKPAQNMNQLFFLTQQISDFFGGPSLVCLSNLGYLHSCLDEWINPILL